MPTDGRKHERVADLDIATSKRHAFRSIQTASIGNETAEV
jgi:hypothetical protein